MGGVFGTAAIGRGASDVIETFWRTGAGRGVCATSGRWPFIGSTTTLAPTRHTIEQVLDILIGQANAARRDALADGVRRVGAVDRYSVLPRYMARAPSGLPGPPAIMRGR